MYPAPSFFYDSERDDKLIGDSFARRECVKAFKQVHDADDLAWWRGLYLGECAFCDCETYCYASHMMQAAPPKRTV